LSLFYVPFSQRLLQIFAELHPLDLLRLSRTGSTLRTTVLSRPFRPVWMQALAATGLPPCPDDLAEPTYAALAFEKHCMARAAYMLLVLTS
jgi:hypothetical protein